LKANIYWYLFTIGINIVLFLMKRTVHTYTN